MTDTPPTDEQPTAPIPPRPRLTRSSEDSLIGGVAGGIGRHLGIDPLAIRITFVILTFAGGIGLLGYLAALAFLPSDDPHAEPVRWGLARTVGVGLLAVAAIVMLAPGWLWGPELSLLLAAGVVAYLLIRVVRDDGADHIGRLAAKIGIGIVLLALAAGGFTAAAAGSALGGGVVIAGLIVACGVGLVGGAFRGGARWLIAPAIVLALPLAAVAATDLDVRGTWGDRTFRPATVADLDRGYEMGVGAMKVDLRDVELPAGRTDLHLDLGMGEIQVLVPEDLCVTSDTTIGVGAVDAGDGEQGGIDLDVDSNARVSPGTRHLHVIADVGVGAVRVGDRDVAFDDFDGHDMDVRPGTSFAACEGTA